VESDPMGRIKRLCGNTRRCLSLLQSDYGIDFFVKLVSCILVSIGTSHR
jgi:hypothetical protein